MEICFFAVSQLIRNQQKFLTMQLRKTNLCYVMLCYVMLCYVMLCYVMLCCVVLCYVISNWGTTRDKYVKKLVKYIQVDVYDDCSGNFGQDNQCQPSSNCNDIFSTFKFYLAFENSVCTDYITEKSKSEYDIKDEMETNNMTNTWHLGEELPVFLLLG